MTEPTVPITEDELHAFVDGELPHDRRSEVESWLLTHPEDAARLASWRTQDEAIRSLYGGVIDEPLPPRFDLDRLMHQRSWSRRLIAASVLFAFLVGGLSGWLGRGLWEGEGPSAHKAVVIEALGAHRLYIAEVRHPVEVAADAKHLLPWLSRRVGNPLRAPDLKVLGLKLMGGRLLPGPRGPAALLMYEGPSGERFTLYCARTQAPETALRYKEIGPVAAFYWVEGEIAYVISGPAERERLHKVAESAYMQMDQGQRAAQRSSFLQ